MPRLVAIASFPYGIPQRALKPGDEFDATEDDAKVLKFARKAKDAKTRAMKSDRTERSQRYRRADMRAEDE